MNNYKKLENKLNNSDVIISSFPKSGRTWVRFFLAKYNEFELNIPFDLEFSNSSENSRVLFTHNFFDFHQEDVVLPEILYPNILLKKKLITIVRDPRDVIISYYHQKKDREKIFSGSLTDFVKSEVYGIERHSDFVLKLIGLIEEKKENKLLISYESLHREPLGNFKMLIDFIYSHVNEENLARAVESSSFSEMKKYEIKISKSQENIDGSKTRFGSKEWKNPNSLKVRSGKVAGHRDELDNEALEYLASLTKTQSLINKLEQISLTN